MGIGEVELMMIYWPFLKQKESNRATKMAEAKLAQASEFQEQLQIKSDKFSMELTLQNKNSPILTKIQSPIRSYSTVSSNIRRISLLFAFNASISD
jgi:hypothetical protein